MYFTQKFRDPDVKMDVVKHNTQEMIFAYFWSAMQTHYAPFKGMSFADIAQTKQIIDVWINDNYATANLSTIADFVCTLVVDYTENKEELRAG